MTWIKICGITNPDDALAAVRAGANAVGFVFAPQSPRCVSPETVKSVIAKLPQTVDKVGVFVNESVNRIQEIVAQTGLTAVQLHGDEDKDFCLALFKALSRGTERPAILRSCPAQIFDKPADENVGWDPVAVGLIEPDQAYKGKRVHKIHVAENGDLFLETHGFRPGVIFGVLLDSSNLGQHGGSGRSFDWERVQPWAGVINSISKLIVAGGLHAGNVRTAIRILRPWGVDVSSGVEREPGRKDSTKIRAFVRAVRTMEGAN